MTGDQGGGKGTGDHGGSMNGKSQVKVNEGVGVTGSQFDRLNGIIDEEKSQSNGNQETIIKINIE